MSPGRAFDWDAYLLGEPDDAGLAEMDQELTFPAPFFGGKRRAAALVWERFGDVVNHVQPFGGSFAVGLSRPAWHRARVETCNDLDGLLVNALRGIAWSPDAVAEACDWPVTEVDLYSRHVALVKARANLTEKLNSDPRFCDPELAAWWLCGASAWIGDGWCRADAEVAAKLPSIGGGADTPRPSGHRGVHALCLRVPRQLMELGGSTKGDATFVNVGKGVHAGGMRVQRQLPHLSGSPNGSGDPCATGGAGIHSFTARTALHETFARLAARLRYVRFPCGDWKRVVTPAVTWRHGLTGLLFDPPYDDGAIDYSVGGRISSEVRAWCVEHWDERLPDGSPAYRIALCGYAGEHDELEALGWEVVAWKARGGYGNQRKDGENENALRERIWFSPACLRVAQAPKAEQLGMFGGAT
jgi:DNA adenine methylase